MGESFRVLIVAPVHRNWGNRVVRESETLAREGFSVTALMRCEDDYLQTNGVTYRAAASAANRFKRFLKLPRLVWQVVRFKADIYHLHNPDTLPVALCLRLLGRKVVYDTHEDYSQRLQLRSWIPAPLRKPLGSVVSACERFTSHIVNATLVTQESQLKHFSSRTFLLRNAPDLPKSRLDRIVRRGDGIPKDERIFYMAYVGGLSEARGLFVMLDSLYELNRRGIAACLWLIGPDLEGCLDRAQDNLAWQYVDYLGVLSHEEALAYVTRADLGLAVLADTGDHRWARPSKLFEYMACGLPFVASDFDSWRSFVKGRGGLWINPDDVDSLVEAVSTIESDGGLRLRLSTEGREFVQEFNWQVESRVLLDIYADLVSGSRRPTTRP